MQRRALISGLECPFGSQVAWPRHESLQWPVQGSALILITSNQARPSWYGSGQIKPAATDSLSGQTLNEDLAALVISQTLASEG